jgi:tetratricopeptide (TPR) repeat protein
MGTQREEALADCNKALELKPGTTDPLETRGFLYYRTGNYAGAIADATAALAIDPKDVDALYIRGLAKKKSADAKGGNADIAAANAIDKKIAKTYAGYGVKP